MTEEVLVQEPFRGVWRSQGKRKEGRLAQRMTDVYNLHRFLATQAHTYDTVLAELRAGRKSSHWIWFIFPQIAGLGHSAMAQQFAIGSLDEAKVYLQRPVLGQRLRECTQLVLNVEGHSAEEIFSYPDNLKFRSCMTLFMSATTDNAIFKDALLKYFDGKPDQSTLDILEQQSFQQDDEHVPQQRSRRMSSGFEKKGKGC